MDSLKEHKVIFAGGLIVALVLLVTGVIIYNANNQAAPSASGNVYSSSQDYTAPGNVAKTIDVSVTLDGNKITALQVKDKAADGTSSKYESAFTEAVTPRIVGKSIKDQFDTTTVNGSSLTTVAFFEAFAEIQAKVK